MRVPVFAILVDYAAPECSACGQPIVADNSRIETTPIMAENSHNGYITYVLVHNTLSCLNVVGIDDVITSTVRTRPAAI